jgi:hypothetical protein
MSVSLPDCSGFVLLLPWAFETWACLLGTDKSLITTQPLHLLSGLHFRKSLLSVQAALHKVVLSQVLKYEPKWIVSKATMRALSTTWQHSSMCLGWPVVPLQPAAGHDSMGRTHLVKALGLLNQVIKGRMIIEPALHQASLWCGTGQLGYPSQLISDILRLLVLYLFTSISIYHDQHHKCDNQVFPDL